MNKKQQFLYMIISIITLGIYPVIINRKTQKTINIALSETKKISVNIVELVKNLGGKENISAIEYTHTKLKVFIKNSSLMEVSSINEQKGISGVFVSSKTITLIVGNQAKQLSKLITPKL